MAEEKPKKLTMRSTKQEMLGAYQEVLKQLQEKREAELRPEKRLEEKKVKEAVQAAESLSSEGAVKEISKLKVEIGKMLTQMSDALDEEVTKYERIKQAVEIREKELKDLYEIERSAATLAALIETQNQKRLEFESEMTAREDELSREIEATRSKWEQEKKSYEGTIKERDETERKRREREKEEYEYTFKREKQLAKDQFDDEKSSWEREIGFKKEQSEKELTEREKLIAERENQLKELQDKVSAFPQELQTAVGIATKETSERVQLEAKNREEMLKKEFEGEKNVLTTRIASLEKTVKEQGEQISNLSRQLENAYQKVQDIAVKAIEGSSESKSLATFQQLITEQARKQQQDK